MTSTQQPPDGDADFVLLPANCGTIVAEELRNRLVLAADCDAGTVIDAGAVQTVGQAVLQLLASARADAIGSGRGFRFAAMSEAFAERVTTACLADLLGIETRGKSKTP